MKQPLLYILFCVIFTSSCVEEDEVVTPTSYSTPFQCTPPTASFSGTRVIVANSDFSSSGSQNRSLTAWDVQDSIIYPYAYRCVNQTYLRESPESLSLIGGRLYIINFLNRDIIDIVDPRTFVNLGSIEGVVNGQHMVEVAPDKAYVTQHLGSTNSEREEESIYIIDLTSNTISGQISVAGQCEEIVTHNGFAYAGAFPLRTAYPSKIYKIDIAQDSLVDSLIIHNYGPRSLTIDAQGNLWALNYGQTVKLYKIDLQTFTFMDSISINGIVFGEWAVRTTPLKDTLIISAQNIYKVPINSTTLGSPIFYSDYWTGVQRMNVDPYTGEIYATLLQTNFDTTEVLRLSPSGVLLDSYQYSVGGQSRPRSIVFYRT